MNTDEGALFDDLLAPISEDAPTGQDVRHAGGYRAIEEARREDDARLPRGIWAHELKQADWAAVERMCEQVLRFQSKDIRVACWLGEAWVKRRGFAAVAPALQLVTALVERYWGALHPIFDGDFEAHINSMEWLSNRLAMILQQRPVVIDARMPDTRFSWADHAQAERLEALRLRDSALAQRTEGVTLEQFNTCRDRTATEVLAATAAAMAAANAALDTLDAAMDARCGNDAPTFKQIRGIVTAIEDYVGEALAARGMQAPALLTAPPAEVPAEPIVQPALAPPIPAPPASREAAYRQLAVIADQLRVAEPHSPVPYVLDYLVEWGAMPLDQIESELSASGSGISILLDAIGLTQHQE